MTVRPVLDVAHGILAAYSAALDQQDVGGEAAELFIAHSGMEQVVTWIVQGDTLEVLNLISSLALLAAMTARIATDEPVGGMRLPASIRDAHSAAELIDHLVSLHRGTAERAESQEPGDQQQ